MKVAVLFGGRSSEHEVSCVSAVTVIKSMDEKQYDAVLVGITKDGRWLKTDKAEEIEDGSWRDGTTVMILSPDSRHKGLIAIGGDGCEIIPVDVVFPVLHGLYGEDGTVQGILELAGIPYVGCGVAASAVSMDKLFTKIIVNSIGGIRQAKYVALRRSELKDMQGCIAKIEDVHNYPVFIKPVNAGSSRGVSKADNRGQLEAGLLLAASHDEKILVEETITGREVECAVFGGAEAEASGVGEVLAAGDSAFYDYDAKYHNAGSKTDLNPELPEGCEEEIRRIALAVFKAVDGFGLARVDFFIEKGTNQIIFNELNTMPGFTAISMYPMLWEARGINKKTLVDKLIQKAFDRHQ